MPDILEDRYIPEPNSGCWLFLGCTNDGGYGRIDIDGKGKYAHRFSYEYHYGAIPQGAWVLHRCDTRICINPRHLRLGTATDNNRDCYKKKRNPIGMARSSAKLNDDIVRQIKAASGSCYAIAKQLNVSRASVWNIRNGLSWKHI